MSIDMPAAAIEQPTDVEADGVAAANSEWVETALTVAFTAAAVLFVSFIAVVSGLV